MVEALRKLDRIAIVIVALAVGLQAIVPGWQITTDGSVYGFKLPENWITGYWPFAGFFVAGLFTAATAAFGLRAYPGVTLLMGIVLVGWIAGELIFMNQTMLMSWVINGSGFALIALSAPYALPALEDCLMRGRRQAA